MKKRWRKKGHGGFTLIELLVVLFVIALLILLFVPNLTRHRETIDNQGTESFATVLTSQIELYNLAEKDELTEFKELVDKGYLTTKQLERANETWTNLEGFRARVE